MGRLQKTLLIAGFMLPWFAFSQTDTDKEKDSTQTSLTGNIQSVIQLIPKEKTVPVTHKQEVEKTKTAKEPPKVTCMKYMMPCLTVAGTRGNISYLPLKFTRTKENKPLRIMVADDTPNGSGKTIHSSVWLAAITAAMTRNDTMHGVTIEIEFTGLIDGPSAGGVTCLTIMSALDGRPLPDDFAMTGTILPDGTIGIVGGIPEKMKAAANDGKKRIFVPAFTRICRDMKGNLVDLQTLADSLNVKLFRVENITEAYALLHGIPYSGNGYVNVREIMRLPKATEDVLKKTFEKYLKKVKWQNIRISGSQKSQIFSNYTLSSQQAETLYREGKLLPATILIIRTWQAIQAWQKTDDFMSSFYSDKDLSWRKGKYLKEYQQRKLLFELREVSETHKSECMKKYKDMMKKYLKQRYGESSVVGHIPFKKEHTEITAQLRLVEFEANAKGHLTMLTARRLDESTLEVSDYDTLTKAWDLEIDILRVIHLQTLPTSDYDDFLSELADTLPKLKQNNRAIEVENLFYSASFAVYAVAKDQLMEKADVLKKKGQNKTLERDNPYFSSFEEMSTTSRVGHVIQMSYRMLLPDPNFHLQGVLKEHVTTFAMSAALMFMYGPDSSNDFLPYLVRNARNAAIKNINECVKAGIPCLAAIYDFEYADSLPQDDKNIYPTLIAYWRASLYAKALFMSFK